jgi:hypothetical protein
MKRRKNFIEITKVLDFCKTVMHPFLPTTPQ